MNAPRRVLAWTLMAASGFASLGCQIVWTQQAGLWLGHEAAAVLAVLAAFFGGLGLGAWTIGRLAERSARPARWYGACEALAGSWTLVLAVALQPASRALLALAGPDPSPAWHWTVAFGGTFVLLLPATAATGATLPAMARLAAAWRDRGSAVAGLYAANTLGAMAGVLAAALWAVPTLGQVRTALLCAGLNALCALLALRWPSPPPLPAGEPAGRGARGLLPLLALTGFLGIGYEVLVVRVASQVSENTVYTFAQLLAVYLAGSALGAAALPALQRRVPDRARLRLRLLQAQGAACLLGGASLWVAPATKAGVLALLGDGLGAALAAEVAVALAAFGPPTLVMGALFAHLADEAAEGGMRLGAVLGANTMGAALAPAAVGVLALPALGPKLALVALALAYLLPGCTRGPRTAAAAAAGAAALALGAPPLVFVDRDPGSRIVALREGALGTVSVVEDADGVRRLRIDNRQQEGSSATRAADGRQALLPVLLHPAPRRVLFLGLGTGITAGAAARDPALQVEAVELLPEVVQAADLFIDEGAPRPRVHVADARRFVRASGGTWDVIVADNVHPARRGSAWLTTTEHFAAVRERLAPGGLFCQWLPLHQLDLPALRSIVAAFLQAFPGGHALLATHSLETPVLGLVAPRDAQPFGTSRLAERLAGAAALRPAEHGLGDPLAVLGSFVAGPAALRDFSAGAGPNTDDRPRLAILAPRTTYVPEQRPRDRLLALLDALGPEPAVALRLAEGQAPRLAAYWRARQRFLALGRDVRPTPDPRRMLAQVGEPLLALLRECPDFRPAREPLLRMAAALETDEPAAARLLRARLDALAVPAEGRGP